MKLKQLTDMVIDNILGNISHDLEDWVLNPFLIYQSTTINRKPIVMSLWFFTLFKMYPETIKKVNIYDKNIALYSQFIKIIKDLELVSTFRKRAKTLEFVDLPNTKSKYPENKTLLFVHIKKIINYKTTAIKWKKEFSNGGNL